MLPYSQSRYINTNVSNNSFSFAQRKNPKLFIPDLIEDEITDIQIGDQIVFEDFDENGELKSCFGLKHFIKTTIQQIPIYIFDNHNHAFYFWHLLNTEAKTLIHIDQHKDSREPSEYLNSDDLKQIDHYTNTILNVGNFISPAVKKGRFDQVIQVNSLQHIENFTATTAPYILDIDLDFLAPEMNYFSEQIKIDFIKKLLTKASGITIATSPFFIDQELAIQLLKKIVT